MGILHRWNALQRRINASRTWHRCWCGQHRWCWCRRGCGCWCWCLRHWCRHRCGCWCWCWCYRHWYRHRQWRRHRRTTLHLDLLHRKQPRLHHRTALVHRTGLHRGVQVPHSRRHRDLNRFCFWRCRSVGPLLRSHSRFRLCRLHDGLLLGRRPLLCRVQKPVRYTTRRKLPTTDVSAQQSAELVVAAVDALDLLEGVAVVVRKTRLGVAVAGGVVGDDAEGRVGRFCSMSASARGRNERWGARAGELVHLPAKENLRLDLAVLDGGLVKVLEDDGALGHLTLPTRLRGWFMGGCGWCGSCERGWCFALCWLEGFADGEGRGCCGRIWGWRGGWNCSGYGELRDDGSGRARRSQRQGERRWRVGGVWRCEAVGLAARAGEAHHRHLAEDWGGEYTCWWC